MAGDGRGSPGLLSAVFVLAALWALSGVLSGAASFVSAAGGMLRAPETRGLVTRDGGVGRDWRPGNEMKKVDFRAAAAQSADRAKKKTSGGEDKTLPKIHTGSKLIYNNEEVGVLNGTMAEYKVDIHKGVHPVWQGKKNKVMMHGSALTRFQEKFGGSSDMFGDAGMEQVEANKKLKQQQKEMEDAGLKVY